MDKANPGPAQLRLTARELQARDAVTATSMDRPRKVDVVTSEDTAVYGVDPQTFVCSQGDLVLLGEELVTAVLGLLAAVLTTVLAPDPVGARESLVWLCISEGLVAAREGNSQELTGLHDPDLAPVRHQHQDAELLVLRALGNRRQALQPCTVVLESQLLADTQVPQALGVNLSRVARLAGDAAGGEARDELLHVLADSRTSAVDGDQLANLSRGQPHGCTFLPSLCMHIRQRSPADASAQGQDARFRVHGCDHKTSKPSSHKRHLTLGVFAQNVNHC